MAKKQPMTIEELAAMIARVFQDSEARFNQKLDDKFERLEKHQEKHDTELESVAAAVRHMSARLDILEMDCRGLPNFEQKLKDIKEILDAVVSRKEFTKLERRVVAFEQKLAALK